MSKLMINHFSIFQTAHHPPCLPPVHAYHYYVCLLSYMALWDRVRNMILYIHIRILVWVGFIFWGWGHWNFGGESPPPSSPPFQDCLLPVSLRPPTIGFPPDNFFCAERTAFFTETSTYLPKLFNIHTIALDQQFNYNVQFPNQKIFLSIGYF